MKLFMAGLQRSVTVLFQRVVRLRKVDQALQGAATRRREIREAIADLEIVLGTYQGKLTASMGAFLDELERGGVIEAMVQCALLERDSPKIRASFGDLYNRFLPEDRKASDLLFARFLKSFEVIHREFSKDKTLFDLVRLQHAELASRLNSVELAINRVKSARIEFSEIENTIGKIAKGALAAFKNVRIETHRGPQNVEIAKIYIAPKVRHRDQETLGKAMRSAGLSELSVMSASSAEYFGEGEQVLLIPYSEMKASFRRIVILGDPGGGKSTLCQRICFDMAKSATLAITGGSRREIPPQDQKIPIRVILRQFEQARQQDAQLDLRTFISRDFAHTVASDAQELQQTLNYLLETGRALLAFDGLDEILDTARRRDYVDLVSAFCNMYPLCPVLVTSRLVGYDFAPMGSEFEEFLLERFDDEEVAAYALKFMVVVGGKDRDKAAEQANRFIQQTAKNASDLRRNPLMLGLMCWLFYWTNDVPTNRPEIYKECAILMFEKWDPNRGIFADVPKDFDRLQLFTYLASRIYGVPELAAGVSTDWLHSEAENYFRTLYADKGKAASEARGLVKFLTGRAWVMTEVGDGVFAFTHQTFLEYFFARSIDDAADRIDDVIKVIIPRVAKREWDVVNHLALQIKSHRNTRRQDEALDALIHALERGKAASRKRAIGSFLAVALEYLSGSEPAVERALIALFENGLRGATQQTRLARLSDVVKAVRVVRERREFAISVVARLMIEALSGDKTEIGELVATGVYAPPTPATYLDPERTMPPEIIRKVRAGIRGRFVSKEVESPYEAAIAWSWFGRLTSEKFEGDAVYWLHRYPPIGTYLSINGLLACVLGATSKHGNDICDSGIGRATYAKALEAVARDGFSGRPVKLGSVGRVEFDAQPPDSIWADMLEELLNREPAQAVGAYLAYCVQRRTVERVNDRDGATRMNAIRERLASLPQVALWPELSVALEDPQSVNVVRIA